MTGYRSGYGNPLNVLLFRERVTCKGCIHLAEVWGCNYCLKDDTKAGSKMVRCIKYEERGANAGSNK